MTKTQVTDPRLPAAAAEKFSYSFGVRAGNMLWISGQVAIRDGEVVGVDDIHAQATQVFENLATIMSAAGGRMEDIVSTTTYMTDRAYSLPINDVRRSYFTGEVLPTSTLIVVAGLARPEFLVEISATAVLD